MAKETTYQNELKSITKNAGITAVGLIVFNLMSFVNNAVITRSLGADQYGLYVLATRIVEFIIVIAMLGLNSSVVRFLSMYIGFNNQSLMKGTVIYVLKTVLISSVIFVVITFLLSNYISEEFFGRPELTFYLRVFLILIPFAAILRSVLSTFVGLKQVKYQVLFANILIPLLFFVLVSSAFLFGFALNGLIVAHISIVIIATMVAWIVLRKTFLKKVQRVSKTVELKKLWNFNIPVYASTIASTAFGLSPIIIMGFFLNNTEIGIYNISYKVGALVVFSISAFKLIFMPTISELFAKRDKETIAALFKTVTKWIFTFSLIIFSLILLFNETILRIFGDEFTSGVFVLILLMTGEMVNASMGLASSIILMSGRSKVTLINSVLQLTMIVGFTWWLTPVYGSIGTAIAYTGTIIIINSVRIIELYNFEKIHPFKLSVIKPLIAGIAAFFTVYFLSRNINLNPIIEMIVGGFVFISIFMLVTLALQLDDDDKYILGLLKRKIRK